MIFSDTNKKGLVFDPRTKLFMMILICTSLIGGCSGPHGFVIRCVLISIPFIAYIFSTTTVSEFTAGMEKMHISEKIVIPFSVMFRFFPTLKEESLAIHDAMRMRQINPFSIENNLVPLMMTALKTGDELSAASLTRGLGCGIKRTNMCKIGFHVQDFVFFIPTLTCFILSTAKF